MFDGRDPIYLQIADQIRSSILDGTLQEEEQVMSTTQYATTYRINPATAAKAFAELVDEGVLYKRRGVGMFVATGARSTLQADGRERFFAEVVDPLVDQAHVLGIEVADVVKRIEDRATRIGSEAETRGAAQGGAR
ncbi:GntR family transcriptional regulator [Cellulomonas cellasea]|uniref:GntR family transcriptional regulator n=2 Tax=Cellulomonas cellasea TaxID=43670 RepID=A0A0A0B3G8_9CELL|nr:GntR family transcriptional regulator [Cellulomonas cellasea]KGM00703.1 GntR family transcriptional regulator [Cellulomonas cellasea DSM 20118]GEA86611.1 GntR family transcriptional regulator [Cellulomonas cellasea]